MRQNVTSSDWGSWLDPTNTDANSLRALLRLDFHMTEPLDKEALTAGLKRLIGAIVVTKIEKKSAMTRRVVLRFVEAGKLAELSRTQDFRALPMATKAPFNAGFRLSTGDVAVLLVGAAGSLLLSRMDAALGLAVAFTVAHFFLFCNVLRMARSLELAWASLFVLLSASTVLNDFPTWSQAFLAMLCFTILVAVRQMRKVSYHGVFWQRVNPNLPQWWELKGRANEDHSEAVASDD